LNGLCEVLKKKSEVEAVKAPAVILKDYKPVENTADEESKISTGGPSGGEVMRVFSQNDSDPNLFLVDAGKPGYCTQMNMETGEVFDPIIQGRILKQGYWGPVTSDAETQEKVIELVKANPPHQSTEPIPDSGVEEIIHENLVWLRRHGEEGSFVIIEDPISEKFVQFGQGPVLLMDLPFAELTDAEKERARHFFIGIGEPSAGNQGIPVFEHDFGNDSSAAVEAVVSLFQSVFRLPSETHLKVTRGQA